MEEVSTKTSLSLELDEQLVTENIVTSFVYDLEILSLVLKLGGKYKNITIISLVTLDDEWKRNIEELQKTLTLKGIEENHIHMICDTADNNAIKISDYVKGRLNNEKQEKEQRHMAFKYSNGGKGDLHEAIILAGKPAFLKYDSKTDKLVVVPRLKEGIRIIVPPCQENYPAYAPYEFENLEEAAKYLERARDANIDSLYSETYNIASDYNDQSPEEIKLLTIAILRTNSQQSIMMW